MKQLAYIISSIAVIILTLGCTQSIETDNSPKQVYFSMDHMAFDKETGDTLKFIQAFLYSLPDTSYVCYFYSAVDVMHKKVILRTQDIEAHAGAQFIVCIGSLDPDIWCQSEETKKNYNWCERGVFKEGGWRDNLWLTYTIPESSNTFEGAVEIRLPEIRLQRVNDKASIHKCPRPPF